MATPLSSVPRMEAAKRPCARVLRAQHRSLGRSSPWARQAKPLRQGMTIACRQTYGGCWARRLIQMKTTVKRHRAWLSTEMPKLKTMSPAMVKVTRQQPPLTSWMFVAYANGLRVKQTSSVNNAVPVRMLPAWKTPLHRLAIGIAQHVFSDLMGRLRRTTKSGCNLISCAI